MARSVPRRVGWSGVGGGGARARRVRRLGRLWELLLWRNVLRGNLRGRVYEEGFDVIRANDFGFGCLPTTVLGSNSVNMIGEYLEQRGRHPEGVQLGD